MIKKLLTLKQERFGKDLHYIFTEWQIKIIRKKLDKKPLTNSEIQEFSRNIKKKIIALETLKELKYILF